MPTNGIDEQRFASRRSMLEAVNEHFAKKEKSDGLTAMDTFYERAADRDRRFVDLVHQVTRTNPAFIAGSDVDAGRVGLAQYLRQHMLMRSAESGDTWGWCYIDERELTSTTA